MALISVAAGGFFMPFAKPAHLPDPTEGHYPFLGCTLASHYGVGDGFHGLTTANGETYNAYDISAAHKTLPFGTNLVVQNQENGASVTVRINDRGPFVEGRDLDLSYAAFRAIEDPSTGVVRVCYYLKVVQ